MSADVVEMCAHEPSVKLTSGAAFVESVICECVKCGRLATFPVTTPADRPLADVRPFATTRHVPQDVPPSFASSVSRGAAPGSGEERGDPCSECDGRGYYTTWPHTTCPVCGGEEREA